MTTAVARLTAFVYMAAQALGIGSSPSANTTVLVFGDSFGDTGPTYKVIIDLLAQQKVPATVRSSAIGGTSACQWNDWSNGTALEQKASKLFPEGEGPEYVWYTLGANDLVQDSEMHK